MDEINLKNISQKADFIREICLKLDLSDEIASEAILYIRAFFEYKENELPNFQIKNVSNLIIIGTSIFLSAKINDNSKRIRDIVNVIYFVDKRHDKISECKKNLEKQNEIYHHLRNDNYLSDEDSTLVKTMGQLTLENYYIIREDILYLEIYLLKIINYEINLTARDAYSVLLKYCDVLKFNRKKINLAIQILNHVYDYSTIDFVNKNQKELVGIVLYLIYKIDDFIFKISNFQVAYNQQENLEPHDLADLFLEKYFPDIQSKIKRFSVDYLQTFLTQHSNRLKVFYK